MAAVAVAEPLTLEVVELVSGAGYCCRQMTMKPLPLPQEEEQRQQQKQQQQLTLVSYSHCPSQVARYAENLKREMKAGLWDEH